MNFKATFLTVLFFLFSSLKYVRSSNTMDKTGSAGPSLDYCNGSTFKVDATKTFTIREKNSLVYKFKFEKVINAANCIHEVSNEKLKFIFNDPNYFGIQSTIIGSKETEGKWNCEVWLPGNCVLHYSFILKIQYNQIKISAEESKMLNPINYKCSSVYITSKDEVFWVRFHSDFVIAAASCPDVNGKGYLTLTYDDSSKKTSVYSYIRVTDETKGPWSCTFEDDLGVKKVVSVNVIWVNTSTSPIKTTQSTITIRTTTEMTTSTKIQTTPTTTSLKTTEETPSALTKSTTEADITNRGVIDKDNSTKLWIIISVATTLIICAILIVVFIVLCRRKAQPTTPTAPNHQEEINIQERVYYTIHGDDITDLDYSYSYAYAKPEPTTTNVTANATYDIGSNK